MLECVFFLRKRWWSGCCRCINRLWWSGSFIYCCKANQRVLDWKDLESGALARSSGSFEEWHNHQVRFSEWDGWVWKSLTLSFFLTFSSGFLRRWMRCDPSGRDTIVTYICHKTIWKTICCWKSGLRNCEAGDFRGIPWDPPFLKVTGICTTSGNLTQWDSCIFCVVDIAYFHLHHGT